MEVCDASIYMMRLLQQWHGILAKICVLMQKALRDPRSREIAPNRSHKIRRKKMKAG